LDIVDPGNAEEILHFTGVAGVYVNSIGGPFAELKACITFDNPFIPEETAFTLQIPNHLRQRTNLGPDRGTVYLFDSL
jgi:hypothetical protein